MELNKAAQRDLFKVLAKSEIKAHQSPEYNGYSIDDFGQFQENLNSLFENFEIELNDNLTNRSPSLEVYLTDINKTIAGINEQVRNYLKEEIIETQKYNPEIFKQNRLGYMNHFLSFQLEIIERTQNELSKKIDLVKNADLFKPVMAPSDPSRSPIFKTKISSNLARVDLAVLLWWLAEAKLLEFDGSHDNFVKFIEDNFQFLDKGKNVYADMKHIGSLMTKLNDPNSPEVNPAQSRKEILDILQKQPLPPINSVLQKNKWKKV